MEGWFKNITFLWCEDSQMKMNNKHQKLNIIKICMRFCLSFVCNDMEILVKF